MSAPPVPRPAGSPDHAAAGPLDDRDLVRRFNAGDEAAFTALAARHRESLVATALGLLRNRADAEELAEDALIRARRGLGRFRGDSSLRVWLNGIVRNLSLNRPWHFFRRHRHLTESFERPLPPAVRLTSPAPRPGDEAEPGPGEPAANFPRWSPQAWPH